MSHTPPGGGAGALLGLGYSYREIMQITGWTYTKVNRCIRDGRTRLRHSNRV
jgi:DNA-directed RNA polymerase specialized sigma24 family protein